MSDESDRLYRRRPGGVWHYRRRVPADVAHLDTRGEIRRSTRRHAIAEARAVAARIDAELEATWAALSSGQAGPAPDAAVAAFDGAVRLARTLGVAYRPTADLAAGPLSEIVRRLEMLEARGLDTVPPAVVAALGGADRPPLRLSDLCATYEEHMRASLRDKSSDQMRKWRNPRLRAVANLVTVLGDRPLASITRADALEFRAWWLDRVIDGGLDPGTANKDLQHLGRMIDALSDAWRLGIEPPFSGLRIGGAWNNARVAYDAEFVRSRILPGDDLASLNDEARDIVRLVAATGMRPSEAAGLTAARIVLDAPIPHAQIRPDGRELKSRNAARDIPLCGVALDVLAGRPSGFPRYCASPDTLSATVNKALGAAGLRPTPGHTLYSLRHTFKDRLIALEAPPRVQDALMGHAVGEIPYGAGPSLEQRARWMARVWGDEDGQAL